jgi:hypothetical protein
MELPRTTDHPLLLRLFALLGLAAIIALSGCATGERSTDVGSTPTATLPAVSPPAQEPGTAEKPRRSWMDILLFRSGGEKADAETPPAPPDPAARQRKWWHVGHLLLFWWPQGEPPPPAASPLFASGTVFSVNQPGGFAIIEAPQGQQLPPGTLLSTLEDGRVTATVRLTADRRPPFIVADLIDGLPTRGDAVFAVKLD